MSLTGLARAKINLCLHVTGKRPDGYHLLDSLVVFAETGDVLRAEPGSGLSLSMDGPFSDQLDAGKDNLVVQAAEAIRPEGKGAALHLTKNLPVASGIGGGSADAAAALRLLGKLWQTTPSDRVAEALGADVPVCLAGRPARMSGIGDILSQAPKLPAVWLLLVNSGQPVSTRAVFSGLDYTCTSPIADMPHTLPDAAELVSWLKTTRNDMERSAIMICPSIETVLVSLRQHSECRFARMSGSGGTCFGIFEGEATALAAQRAIARAHPRWWSVVAPMAVT